MRFTSPPLAAAHADAVPHVHAASPRALILVAAWKLLEAASLRRVSV